MTELTNNGEELLAQTPRQSTDDLKTWLIEKHRQALIDGVALGVLQERERIIKLLKEQGPALQPFVALIKGQNKPSHKHEIEVFGAPCDCGTRHEYCGDCDWVEPCEPEGENK